VLRLTAQVALVPGRGLAGALVAIAVAAAVDVAIDAAFHYYA